MITADYSSVEKRYAEELDAYIYFYALHPPRRFREVVKKGKNWVLKEGMTPASTQVMPSLYEPRETKSGTEEYIQTNHVWVTDPQTAKFFAFVNDYDESFSSSWESQQYYGKTDAFVGFKNTRRVITLSWKIPSSTIEEAIAAYDNLNALATMFYPTYLSDMVTAEVLSEVDIENSYHSKALFDIASEPKSRPLGKPPVVGVSWGNLVRRRDPNQNTFGKPWERLKTAPSKAQSLVCHVDNFSMAPEFDAGFFHTTQHDPDGPAATESGQHNGKLYPKVWACSIVLNVQHTHEMGRQEKMW